MTLLYSSSSISMDVAAALVVTCSVWYLAYSHSQKNEDTSNIPWAADKLPILGHALAYRKDPAGFLLRTYHKVGGIFQLNLAGKHMFVVGDMDAQRQVSKAPERILSARQAVADIGFDETLGKLNVYQGTDLHKGIVKAIWQEDPKQHVESWVKSLRASLETETAGGSSFELFHLIRRVVLRSSIDRMVSPEFLDGFPLFLDDFMGFQDQLEDVTPKAVILPRWIALPGMLWPVKRRREKLQVKIAKRLDDLLATSSPSLGFWLAELHSKYSTKDIAEYMVGLLFAAHKNPAIGASQMYLMMFEECSENEQQEIREEAQNLLSDIGLWNDKTTSLYKLCLETLRLTAHSIGSVRTAKEPFELQVGGQSYRFPKGASIGLTHITLSLQPGLWGDNATRLDLKAHPLDKYQDEYQFSTFSNGLHRCPGQQLAVVILQLTVALLLVEYDVSLPSRMPHLSFERATLAQREGPVRVQVIKRK
jgi:cytochrome P450